MRSSSGGVKCCCKSGRNRFRRLAIVSTWNGMTARATPEADDRPISSALPSVTSTATTTQISCFWARKVRAHAVKYAYTWATAKAGLAIPICSSTIEDAFGVNLQATGLAGSISRAMASGPGRWRRRGSYPDLRQQWHKCGGSVRRPPRRRPSSRRAQVDRCLRRRRRRRSRPDDPRDRLADLYFVEIRGRIARAPVIAAMVAGPGLP